MLPIVPSKNTTWSIFECGQILETEKGCDVAQLDKDKSIRAASLIVEYRINLGIRDLSGKTVLHYMEETKNQLPLTYETINAGLIKQLYERERRDADKAAWYDAMKLLYIRLAPSAANLPQLESDRKPEDR